jgi:hypothetical protein
MYSLARGGSHHPLSVPGNISAGFHESQCHGSIFSSKYTTMSLPFEKAPLSPILSTFIPSWCFHSPDPYILPLYYPFSQSSLFLLHFSQFFSFSLHFFVEKASINIFSLTFTCGRIFVIKCNPARYFSIFRYQLS